MTQEEIDNLKFDDIVVWTDSITTSEFTVIGLSSNKNIMYLSDCGKKFGVEALSLRHDRWKTNRKFDIVDLI